MKDEIDPSLASLREEFVSQASAALKGATNLTVSPYSPDTSRYFCNGIFADHYGAIRSGEAVGAIMGALTAL